LFVVNKQSFNKIIMLSVVMTTVGLGVMRMALNATFDNISVLSFRTVFIRWGNLSTRRKPRTIRRSWSYFQKNNQRWAHSTIKNRVHPKRCCSIDQYTFNCLAYGWTVIDEWKVIIRIFFIEGCCQQRSYWTKGSYRLSWNHPWNVYVRHHDLVNRWGISVSHMTTDMFYLL
jgi:hypothetical protein